MKPYGGFRWELKPHEHDWLLVSVLTVWGSHGYAICRSCPDRLVEDVYSTGKHHHISFWRR